MTEKDLPRRGRAVRVTFPLHVLRWHFLAPTCKSLAAFHPRRRTVSSLSPALRSRQHLPASLCRASRRPRGHGHPPRIHPVQSIPLPKFLMISSLCRVRRGGDRPVLPIFQEAGQARSRYLHLQPARLLRFQVKTRTCRILLPPHTTGLPSRLLLSYPAPVLRGHDRLKARHHVHQPLALRRRPEPCPLRTPNA